MKNKSILGVLLSAVIMFVMIGCGQTNTSTTSKTTDSESTNTNNISNSSQRKKYLIACDSKYAPFSFEEDGKYIGIDVELIDAISKISGFEYELKPMDFNGIIPALKANQIDGSIAGMNITEERKESVDFSEGYIKSGSSIVVNANNTDINSLNDLQNKSAAVKKGTTGAKFAEDNEKKYGLKINYFEDSPSMFQAVENGNCDFLVEDFPVISYKIKVDTNSKLRIAVNEIKEAPYNGFAVNKGENQELLEKFNDGLSKIKENGEYDRIVEQYITD